jgi:hypothetical protein
VIFTNDVSRLAQQLGTGVNKTSALEISHSDSFAQGMMMT